MMFRVALSIAILAGCGGTPPPAAAPAPAPPPPAASPQPAPPPTVLETLAAFADEMCACKDEACAQVVQARVSTFSRTAAASGPAPEADRQRAQDIGERYGRCMAPLLANAPVVLGPDGLPTSCKEYEDQVMRILRCPAVEQATKDALAASYKETREAFSSVPRDKMSQLAFACSTAVEAVRRTKTSACP